MKNTERKEIPKKPSDRSRTEVPGQNPKQNDSPEHDQNNDENRINVKKAQP